MSETKLPETKLLHDFEVSKMLGVSINTLRNWRYQKKGPVFVKLEGRSIMYERIQVETFISKSRESEGN
jgi:predicted DNA-binding transcriptional regulator AlpA